MMKILWIINIVLPEAMKLLNIDNDLKTTGGWLLGAANILGNQTNIKLVVASPSTLVNNLCFLQGEKIGYYILPMGKGNTHKNPDYRNYWRKIYEEFRPDIVHIHGTEYSHGLEYMEECGSDKVVISIQGLTSIYYKYYYGGISAYEIFRHITLHDIIRGSIFHGKRRFQKRGEYEKEMIRRARYIIGRTSWDKSHVWAINPHAHYYFCNETLRPAFYDGEEWVYANCRPHSIFLSQATYPIKGLQIVIKAMPLILRKYPDAIIRIAGTDVTRSKDGLWGILKISGYGKIIKSMIKKYQLSSKVNFIGNLDAESMKNEYLRANVFVCPSSIENSPNSLGEAQILGVPVIASYVGGVADMMKGDEDHLYRFEEVEMLAQKVCNVFESLDNQTNMKDVAKKRHDRYANLDSTIAIYKKIIYG